MEPIDGMKVLQEAQTKLQHMGYMIESVKLNGQVIQDNNSRQWSGLSGDRKR